MKYLTIIFLCLIINFSFAQVTFEGKVVDHTTNSPIEGVYIILENLNSGVTSKPDGTFKIFLNELPSNLIISHMGYKNYKKTITEKNLKENILYLYPQVNILNEITVTPQEQTKKISEPSKYSIQDFVIHDKNIFRIEFYGVLKGKKLTVTDFQGRTIDQMDLKQFQKVKGLYKTCTDAIYILTKRKAYRVSFVSNMIIINENVLIDTFINFIQPCKIRIKNELIYLNEYYNGLMKVISVYNVDEDMKSVLRVISNEGQLNNYKKDFNYISKSQSISTIRTNDPHESEIIRNIQENGDFLISIFYKPLYPVDISSKNNDLIIVNHIENRIESYHLNVKKDEVIKIDYINDESWLKKIIIDNETEKIYSLFNLKKGVGIKELSIETGKSKLIAIIDTPLENYRNIKISNNNVFYLVKSQNNMTSMVKYKL